MLTHSRYKSIDILIGYAQTNISIITERSELATGEANTDITRRSFVVALLFSHLPCECVFPFPVCVGVVAVTPGSRLNLHLLQSALHT